MVKDDVTTEIWWGFFDQSANIEAMKIYSKFNISSTKLSMQIIEKQKLNLKSSATKERLKQYNKLVLPFKLQ